MGQLTLRNNEFTLAKLESAGSKSFFLHQANSGPIINSHSGAYLSSREFKGLEARYGMDEPAVLEEGRGGIARGYEEERA
jgi:diphthamide biosynthesis protein 2